MIRKSSQRHDSSIDTEKLLGSARPRERNNRQRNLENIQLTGLESIVFRSCETLSVEADVDDDNLLQALADGTAKSVVSVVAVAVCKTDSCYSSAAGSRTTYVTSLADYLSAFSEFLPSKQEEYCEACLENYDYCLEQQRNNNRDRRHLAGNVVYQTIDCGRCFSYGCMWNENEYYRQREQWNQQQSKQWIQAVSGCYQNRDNPVKVNGQEVSFGFMCNQEGTGIEVAAFLDDECTLYTNQVAFGNVMSSTDYYMWSKSKTNVQYIFNNDFSCYDPEIKYVRPEEFDGNVNNGNNNDGDVPDAGEWCYNVFAGDMTPVAMAECGDIDSVTTESNGYYNYTLSIDNAENTTAICTTLKANGGGEHIYSRYQSGAMYRYNAQSSTPYVSSYTGTGSGNTMNSNSSNWMNTLDTMAKQFHSNTSSSDRNANIGWICATAILAGFVVALAVDRVRKATFSADNREPMLSNEPSNPGYKRRFFRKNLILT